MTNLEHQQTPVNPLDRVEWGANPRPRMTYLVDPNSAPELFDHIEPVGPDEGRYFVARQLTTEFDLKELVDYGVGNLSYDQFCARAYRDWRPMDPMLFVSRSEIERDLELNPTYEINVYAKEAISRAKNMDFTPRLEAVSRRSDIVDPQVAQALSLKLIDDTSVGSAFEQLYTKFEGWNALKTSMVKVLVGYVQNDPTIHQALQGLSKERVYQQIADWLAIITAENSVKHQRERSSEYIYPLGDSLEESDHGIDFLPYIYQSQISYLDILSQMARQPRDLPVNLIQEQYNYLLGVKDKQGRMVRTAYWEKYLQGKMRAELKRLGRKQYLHLDTMELLGEINKYNIILYNQIMQIIPSLDEHIKDLDQQQQQLSKLAAGLTRERPPQATVDEDPEAQMAQYIRTKFSR